MLHAMKSIDFEHCSRIMILTVIIFIFIIIIFIIIIIIFIIMMFQLDNLRNMMPWSGGVGGGKLTVIKAGPGFHEEKSFDIGADGHITEVKPITMMKDGLDHHNPMDNMFNSEDVEMFHVDVEPQNIDKIDTEPVMDVRDLEDEPVKETVTPEVATKEVEEVEKLPYLSVLRNNVEQEEEEVRNWSEKLLNQYRRVAEREYLDSECSSQTL